VLHVDGLARGVPTADATLVCEEAVLDAPRVCLSSNALSGTHLRPAPHSGVVGVGGLAAPLPPASCRRETIAHCSAGFVLPARGALGGQAAVQETIVPQVPGNAPEV
jgi:hypothetical protein